MLLLQVTWLENYRSIYIHPFHFQKIGPPCPMSSACPRQWLGQVRSSYIWRYRRPPTLTWTMCPWRRLTTEGTGRRPQLFGLILWGKGISPWRWWCLKEHRTTSWCWRWHRWDTTSPLARQSRVQGLRIAGTPAVGLTQSTTPIAVSWGRTSTGLSTHTGWNGRSVGVFDMPNPNIDTVFYQYWYFAKFHYWYWYYQESPWRYWYRYFQNSPKSIDYLLTFPINILSILLLSKEV